MTSIVGREGVGERGGRRERLTMISVVFPLSAVLQVLNAAAALPEFKVYCLNLLYEEQMSDQIEREGKWIEFGEVLWRSEEREN